MSDDERTPVGYIDSAWSDGQPPERVVLHAREGSKVYLRAIDPCDPETEPVPVYEGDDVVMMEHLSHVSHHLTLDGTEGYLLPQRIYVLAATAADTAAETIDRIVHQIVTNDQKRDLSDAQRARGIQQMIDAGLSVTKVAKIHRLKYAPCIVARPSVSAEVQIPAGASC